MKNFKVKIKFSKLEFGSSFALPDYPAFSEMILFKESDHTAKGYKGEEEVEICFKSDVIVEC